MVFQGLAGLLRGISQRRSPREISQIYLLFLIGFCIGPPKLHRRFRIRLPKMHRHFRIGPPKMHRRFRVGPLQVSLNLFPPELHRRGIMLNTAIMKEKKNLFEIEWSILGVLS